MVNCAIVGGMSISYEALLRDKLGEPNISNHLWQTVTSVEAGDERAYGEALLTIDRMSWRDFKEQYYDAVASRWIGRMLSGPMLPGGALEALFSAEWASSQFREHVVAHQNITERLERDALQSSSRLVREALAGNPSISDDTVKAIRKSRSHSYIGKLLSNSALDGETLRDLIAWAKRIGMEKDSIAYYGCQNASMPVDVTLEWATGDQELRSYAMGSPVLPRDELVRLLLEGVGVDGSVDHAAGFAFERRSNADGALIDWYVNMWFQRAGSSARPPYRGGVACALSHPRAWGSTLERAYMLCGDGKYGNEIVESILRSPSCPDWVRWDVLARGDERLIYVAATWCSNVPPGFVRALADRGYWWYAVSCANAPGDVLADAVEHIVNLYKWQGGSSLAEHQFGRFLASENMPPEVRRECARWSHVSLWAVARDGFLGRI